MKQPLGLAFITAVFFLAHGALLGPSDDEAYYWTLSHRWNWGFAYHPPMITWLIGLSREFWSWLLPENHPFVLRFPAAACIFGIFYFSLSWINLQAIKKINLLWAWMTLLSFVGLTSSIWMSVPDLPLFLGWSLSFYCLWRLLTESKRLPKHYLGLGFGIFVSLMSKFSAILMLGSIVLSILLKLWFGRFKKSSSKTGGGIFSRLKAHLVLNLSRDEKKHLVNLISVISVAAVLGVIPSLLWNLETHWGPLNYQLEGRHQGSEFSLKRGLGFWLAQSLLFGPVWIGLFFQFLTQAFKKLSFDQASYTMTWVLPPLILFGLQPFFSPFKLHWIFIAFFPGLLLIALKLSRQLSVGFWIKAQWHFGISLSLFFIVSMHFPLQSKLIQFFSDQFDPKWDVTNDLYGWKQLSNRIPKDAKVVGSRYQTASQAAFALNAPDRVTLLPLTQKEFQDWPDLKLISRRGDHWGEIKEKFYYVADHRYLAPPQYQKQDCQQLDPLVTRRSGILAKEVFIWFCQPE